MTAQTQAVLDGALALPPTERAGIIEQLLASFDAPSRMAVDEAWARETEQRIDAHDQGMMRAHPLGEVVDRINAR